MGFVHQSLGYTDNSKGQYFSILNFFSNELIIYDYSSKEIIQRVKMEQAGPDGVGALPSYSSHLIISRDSFLVYNGAYAKAFLVDDSARVLKKYDIVDLREDKVSQFHFLLVYIK